MSKLGHPPMPPITITVQGVDKLLTGLNPNKAQGPDEISPRLLKELHTEIAPISEVTGHRYCSKGLET